MLDEAPGSPSHPVSFRRQVATWKEAHLLLWRLLPMSLSGFLVAWTVFVCPYTDRHDVWASVMALSLLPAVVIAHLALIAVDRKRAEAVLYGIIHVPAFAWVLLFCLILIGKSI